MDINEISEAQILKLDFVIGINPYQVSSVLKLIDYYVKRIPIRKDSDILFRYLG
jgi:hypothetical protein